MRSPRSLILDVLIYILIIDYDTLGLEHWPQRLVFYNLIIV